MASLEVQGLDATLKALKNLNPTKEEMVSILTKAANPLWQAMKQKCPIDEGNLQIKIVIQDKSEGNDVMIGVGIFDPETAKYAIYQEFGTGKYATGPGGSRAKKIPWLWKVESAKWAAIFGIEIGESILWYGNHPHPFVRPAWDEQLENIKGLIQSGAAKVIKLRGAA
jgi:HK97 gp10 family phage protein